MDDIDNGFFKVRMFVCSMVCVFCVCEWMVELSGAVEIKIFRKKCIGTSKRNKGEDFARCFYFAEGGLLVFLFPQPVRQNSARRQPNIK